MNATQHPRDDEGRNEVLGEMLNAEVCKLGEHFDSVIIIGTKRDSNARTHRFTSWDGDD